MSVVRTENLTKEFKGSFLVKRHSFKALDNLNLEIEEGEIFGYLGPNGAGKTTTFKLLLGLIFPTSGAAWIFGENIREVEFKARLGFLPEHPYFYDYLTGEEFLDFYAQLFGFDRKIRRRIVRRLLETVALEQAASKQLRKFSRGMLQRIGIAQALINDPELVILDEPLSGLDPVGRKEIRDIILRLKSEGRTVIFSSHVLSDVEAICDRIGVLIHGRLQSVERLNKLLDMEVESVEMVISGLNGNTEDIIQSLGGQVACRPLGEPKDNNGGRTVFAVHGIGTPAGEEALIKVLAAMRESGAKLVSMGSRTRSLEDLFMELGGK